MSYMEPIILYDGKKHQPIPNGDKLSPSVLPVDTGIDNVMTVGDSGLKVSTANMVSASEGNGIHVGVDGKLMVTLPEVPTISADAGNYLRLGNDRGFFVGNGEFLSRDSDNIATIDSNGKVKVAARDIAEGLISKTSECNLLHLTSDGKLAVSPDVVVSGSTLESAEVATNPSGQEAGTYLRLVFKKLDDGSLQTSYVRLPDPVAAGEGAAVVHQDGQSVVSVLAAPDGGLEVTCEGLSATADIARQADLDAVKENVARNTEDISKLKADVAENTKNISVNTANITANTNAIDLLKYRADQLEKDTSTHTEQIAVLEREVATHEEKLADLEKDMEKTVSLTVSESGGDAVSLDSNTGVLYTASDCIR